MICTYVFKQGGKGVKSPVDYLERRNEDIFYTETIYPPVESDAESFTIHNSKANADLSAVLL